MPVYYLAESSVLLVVSSQLAVTSVEYLAVVWIICVDENVGANLYKESILISWLGKDTFIDVAMGVNVMSEDRTLAALVAICVLP